MTGQLTRPTPGDTTGGRSRGAATAALVSGAALALVTAIVLLSGTLTPLDPWALRVFSPVHSAGVVHELVATFSVSAAAPVGLAVLLLVAGVVSRLDRTARPFVVALSASALLVLGVEGGKYLVGRARPATGLVVDPEPSFPSGHSATAVVVAVLLLVLLGPRLGSRARRAGQLVGVAYVLVIGVGRLYLGVHWASDVLAGWLLGTLVVAACLWHRMPDAGARLAVR